MRKRFWVALLVGAAVGASVVIGFGPFVRSRLKRKAEAYGAKVHVDGVSPSLRGVRLSGVDVSIDDLPGVSVHLDDVVVGWTSQRPVSLSGGMITAVGTAKELFRRFERWRVLRSKKNGGSSGAGAAIKLDDFKLDWRNRQYSPERSLAATGVVLQRREPSLRFAAATLRGQLDGTGVHAENGVLELRRTNAGYRVAALTASALELDARLGAGAAPLSEFSPPTDAGLPAQAYPDAKASPGSTPQAAPPPAPSDRRVRAARFVYRTLVAAADRFEDVFTPQATVMVGGTRAILRFSGESLNLGPGTLSLARQDDALVVALSPTPSQAATAGSGQSARALTFTLHIPLSALDQRGNPRSLVAELQGGPVWLSALGVRDGDLGLQDVASTSLESDARLVLEPGGKNLTIDGRGKLHKMAIYSPKLASQPLRSIELAWRAKADLNLDGSAVRVRAGEVDLGHFRFLFDGSYQRGTKGHQLDLNFEIPMVNCQQVFSSLPSQLVPRLAGLRFAGTLAAKGKAHFDTAQLNKTYHLHWDGSLGCRVVEVPPALNVERFKRNFSKVVYTPTGQEQTMEFGPQTRTWVPIDAISHFMEGAVLTTEDGRFYRHRGFDQEAIVNSIRENIKAGRFVRGASTISMQLARNLYLRRGKTLSRKLQEAILTLYLEQALTKREMMELYLNIIEFGPMIYGVGPAARYHFNQSAAALSFGQAMYLASILPLPNKQHYGANGAVTPAWTSYLHRLMRITNKIGRVSDEQLEVGLRETPVFGSPSPQLAPAEPDIYGELDQDGQATAP